jgi:nitrogen fixation-related uncharacterized protein
VLSLFSGDINSGTNHTYKRLPFDPEGTLSTFTALLNCWVGVLLGVGLLRAVQVDRSAGSWKWKLWSSVMVSGMVSIGTGYFWWWLSDNNDYDDEVDQLRSIKVDAGDTFTVGMPVSKSLWTPSFVLISAGFSLVGFGLTFWALEMPEEDGDDQSDLSEIRAVAGGRQQRSEREDALPYRSLTESLSTISDSGILAKFIRLSALLKFSDGDASRPLLSSRSAPASTLSEQENGEAIQSCPTSMYGAISTGMEIRTPASANFSSQPSAAMNIPEMLPSSTVIAPSGNRNNDNMPATNPTNFPNCHPITIDENTMNSRISPSSSHKQPTKHLSTTICKILVACGRNPLMIYFLSSAMLSLLWKLELRSASFPSSMTDTNSHVVAATTQSTGIPLFLWLYDKTWGLLMKLLLGDPSSSLAGYMDGIGSLGWSLAWLFGIWVRLCLWMDQRKLYWTA